MSQNAADGFEQKSVVGAAFGVACAAVHEQNVTREEALCLGDVCAMVDVEDALHGESLEAKSR